MTPKEKAEELIKKYQSFEANVLYKDLDDDTAIACNPMTHNTAKQCALIAVDEILKELDAIYSRETVMSYTYWEYVKDEINNL